MSRTAMPVLFLAHGSPMNIVDENPYTAMLRELGRSLPLPKAVLVVSAHWLTDGTRVSSDKQTEPMYDFFGFPEPLYAVHYAPPGSPETARKIVDRLPEVTASSRRIDHGAWALMYHLFPEADVPLLQLSIDRNLAPEGHWELGERLAFLRSEGVLIVGSGNVTHNLGAVTAGDTPPPEWAKRFDGSVADALEGGDREALCGYERWGEAARTSLPTAEHYLPLLYGAGAARGSRPKALYRGFQNGSVSMSSWIFE